MNGTAGTHPKETDKWPRRIIKFLVIIGALFLLLRGCVYVFAPNGGHLFDSYEVLRSVSNSSKKLNAVMYEYKYAELSNRGQSLWLIGSTPPEIGSKALPDGEAVFTWIAEKETIEWSWSGNDKVQVKIPPNAMVRTTKWPSDCFWDYSLPTICLHSSRAIVRMK